ncbi:MAG: hypothetical protein Q9211_001699 [Gyalolechia sp. 1 TL-2023]
MDKLTLKERAADILERANTLSDELTTFGLPEPSFEHGLAAALGNDAPDSRASEAKLELLQSLDEMRALLTEPARHLTSELAKKFPSQGSTIADLAQTTGVKESLLRRLLSHCATYHIFYQASHDFYVHTAASRLLAEDEGIRAWALLGAEEIFPSTYKTAEALIEYPDSEEPQHCGWSVQNGTDLPIFRALAGMPARAARFGRSMIHHATQPGFSPAYLVSAFPWASFDSEVHVVDVGGSLGHISEALVAHSPHVRCTVQDSPGVVAEAQKKQFPANIQGRISFQAHDFFDPQPVQGADVYLLRLILHDWSDKYCIMIIRALIPALKAGAKVIVNDRVIPALGEAHYLVERESRFVLAPCRSLHLTEGDYDMYMLAFQNAKERTAEDWKSLFREADERFELTRVEQPPKATLAVVEVTWKG